MKLYFLIVLVWNLYAADYSMSDLKALHSQNNFTEYLDNALSIRPSARDGNWELMTREMAYLKIKTLLSKKLVSVDTFKEIEKLYTWPALKGDELFTRKREEFGLTFLKECFFNKIVTPSECTTHLHAFLSNNDMNSRSFDTDKELAILTYGFLPEENPFDLLAPHLKKETSEFFCKDETIKVIITNQLFFGESPFMTSEELNKKIDRTIHLSCYEKLIQNLSSENSERSFRLLDAKGRVNLKDRTLFLVSYLLNGPTKGALFNEAFTLIVTLSQDHKRRDEVITELTKKSFLPDRLLLSDDEPLKKSLLEHFKLYFPELLSLYTTSCLSFYEGKSDFSFGNPTKNCKNFMELSQKIDLIPKSQVDRFKKLVRF